MQGRLSRESTTHSMSCCRYELALFDDSGQMCNPRSSGPTAMLWGSQKGSALSQPLYASPVLSQEPEACVVVSSLLDDTVAACIFLQGASGPYANVAGLRGQGYLAMPRVQQMLAS